MFEAFKILVLIAFILHFIRILLSHYLTWSFFARYDKFYRSRYDHEPEVSIIIPIKEIDHELQKNIQSLCKQDYSKRYEVLFCVENSNEPAFPMIRKIVSQFPHPNSKIVESDDLAFNAFGKIKNLIAGVSVSQYEVLIFLDSDVTVSRSFLREVVSEVGNSKIGLAFSCPACRGTENFMAALHNIGVNETVLNLTPLFRMKKGYAATGSTIITTRKVLEEIGGLQQFSNQIAEDVPLSKALIKKGYQIQLLKKPSIMYHPRDNFIDLSRQIHRWMVTIRHYLPEAIAFIFIAELPIVLVTLYFILSLFHQNQSFLPLLLFLTMILTHLISTAIINWRFAKDRKLWKYIWAVLFTDFLKLPIAIYSCLSNKVFWRGRWLKINRDHTVTVLDEEKS